VLAGPAWLPLSAGCPLGTPPANSGVGQDPVGPFILEELAHPLGAPPSSLVVATPLALFPCGGTSCAQSSRLAAPPLSAGGPLDTPPANAGRPSPREELAHPLGAPFLVVIAGSAWLPLSACECSRACIGYKGLGTPYLIDLLHIQILVVREEPSLQSCSSTIISASAFTDREPAISSSGADQRLPRLCQRTSAGPSGPTGACERGTPPIHKKTPKSPLADLDEILRPDVRQPSSPSSRTSRLRLEE
jgi:hypothetical protein